MEHFSSVSEAIEFLQTHMHIVNPRADFPDSAQYLGKSGDQRAFIPLIEALQYGSEYIRSTAALGLGHLSNTEAVPYLMKALLYDPGLYVRCDAALALGYLRQEEVLPFLLERFVEEDFEVQKRIIMAIVKIHTNKAKDAIVNLQESLNTIDTTPGKRNFLNILITQGLEEFNSKY